MNTATETNTTDASSNLDILGTSLSRRTVVVGAALASALVSLGGGSALKAWATEGAAAGTYEDELPIAVVNFQPVWGDVEANVASMVDYVEQAAEHGTGLLLFPEMCVTGYVWSEDATDEDSQMAITMAETVDGPTATALSELAQKHGMWIVYGGTEVIEGDAEHAYNSAFACSPDGLVSTYQKIHPVEGAWCTPGTTPMILDTQWGKVGVDICYDTYAIPELERYYAAQGCRLLLNPTATSRGFDAETGDSTLWQWYFESRIKNIAIRDQIFVASANLAGFDGSHFTFPGGSSVFGPSGEDGSTTFVKLWAGDTTVQDPSVFGEVIDLSLATATDILASANYRPELFASWYRELAEMGDDVLAAAPMETTAVVGTVNFQPTFGDKEANFQSMSSYIEEAAAEGTNILVFPEMALTGYAWCAEEGEANGQTVVDIAEPIDGEYATKLSELAAENEMYVVFGTSEPVEGDTEHAYNTVFVCTPEGDVLPYRKVAPVEGPWCLAGDAPLVVETPYGALGVSICKDTYAYPELARYYMARGCAYLLNPTARTGTAVGWAELYQNSLENLADQDKMIVVSADLCGADLAAPEEQASWDPYTGASVVTVPLAEAADGSYVQTAGSYVSDPEAVGLITATLEYDGLSLGLGEAIYFFDPEFYASLYEGTVFENTTADLAVADAA